MITSIRNNIYKRQKINDMKILTSKQIEFIKDHTLDQIKGIQFSVMTTIHTLKELGGSDSLVAELYQKAKELDFLIEYKAN